METPKKTWHQIVSKQMYDVAMHILRCGDLENRRSDAVNALESALAYWPDNGLAAKALRRLRLVREPRL